MSANGLQKLTPKKVAFLAAIRQVASIARAAEVAGCSRQAHYKWHIEDEEYRKAFATAKQEALTLLEDEAYQRAVHGMERLKFDAKGQPLIDPRTGEPYTERVVSDILLMFLLKALAPHKYRERSVVTLSAQADADLTARMEQMQRILNEIGDSDQTKTQEFVRKRAKANRSVSLDVRRNGKRQPADEV